MAVVEGAHPQRLWSTAAVVALLSMAYYGAQTVASSALYQEFGQGSFGRDIYFYLGMAMLLVFPLGGLVADKWLGVKRTLQIGALLAAVGVAACILHSKAALLVGAVLLTVGEGLCRYNLYVFLGEAYPKLAPMRVAGFVVLFLAGSIGAWLASAVSQAAMSLFSTSVAFAVLASPAMIAFVVLLAMADDRAPSPQTETPLAFTPQLMALAAIAGALFIVSAAMSAVSRASIPSGMGSLSTATAFMVIFNAGPLVSLTLGGIAAFFWSGGTRSTYSDVVGRMIALAAGALAVGAVMTTLTVGESGLGLGATVGGRVMVELSALLAFPVAFAAATALAPQAWRATAMGVFALFGIGRFIPVAKVIDGFGMTVLGVVILVGCAAGVAIAMVFSDLIESAVDGSVTDAELNAGSGAGSVAADSSGRGGATTDLIVGGIALMVGLSVTIGSFAAARGGGQYVITTGLIIFGLFRVVRGFSRLGS